MEAARALKIYSPVLRLYPSQARTTETRLALTRRSNERQGNPENPLRPDPLTAPGVQAVSPVHAE